MADRVCCQECGATDQLEGVCLSRVRRTDPPQPMILCWQCTQHGQYRRRDKSYTSVDEYGNRTIAHPDYLGKPVTCQ